MPSAPDAPLPRLPAAADELRVRSWVSQATLHRKLGDSEAAVRLLRKAARAEPKVGWCRAGCGAARRHTRGARGRQPRHLS